MAEVASVQKLGLCKLCSSQTFPPLDSAVVASQGLLRLQVTFIYAVTPPSRGALGKVRSFPHFHRQFVADRSAVPSVAMRVCFLVVDKLLSCCHTAVTADSALRQFIILGCSVLS